MSACTVCDKKIGFGQYICVDCHQEQLNSPSGKTQIELAKESKLKEYERNFSQIILTTAPTIEGYNIIETIEVISAECVFGLNVFKDFFVGLSDFFGGRNESTQNALRNARKTCLSELKKEALSIGANGVIAIDLDYSEFSGKNTSMLFLVASGTAVKLEKVAK